MKLKFNLLCALAGAVGLGIVFANGDWFWVCFFIGTTAANCAILLWSNRKVTDTNSIDTGEKEKP